MNANKRPDGQMSCSPASTPREGHWQRCARSCLSLKHVPPPADWLMRTLATSLSGAPNSDCLVCLSTPDYSPPDRETDIRGPHPNFRLRIDGFGARASGQFVDQLLHRHPWPGEERDLFADVPPRVGGTQVTHQVDDAVQLRRLEREDPLVVA